MAQAIPAPRPQTAGTQSSTSKAAVVPLDTTRKTKAINPEAVAVLSFFFG